MVPCSLTSLVLRDEFLSYFSSRSASLLDKDLLAKLAFARVAPFLFARKSKKWVFMSPDSEAWEFMSWFSLLRYSPFLSNWESGI